ncbi:MAG TPA: hypothetical protein VGR96_04125 [Acidobacteriaceae bacterium]|nr:hypothetical protein [Acidobacteriaceae bacterium]
MSSRLKGIARIVFFAVDFLVFSAMLSKNTKRIALVAVALAISDLVRLPTFGGFNATGWKFGGSLAVSILVMLLGSWFSSHRRYGAFVLLVLALAVLNLHYGYRSQVAVDLVTVVFTLPILPRAFARGNSAANDRIRAAVLLFCSAGALWAAQKAIHEAAKFGAFEDSVEAKFEQQSSGKLGVLIGARPEIPVSLRAIADAPVLGHGSYATDPKYAILLQEYQYKYGYSESDAPDEDLGAGIPTHSHLTGAWVDGGVLASLLWLYLLWQIVRAAVVISSKRPTLSPLYAFLFITFFWDILFSPFGYDRRIYESVFIVLLIDLTAKPTAKQLGRLRTYYVRRVYSGVPNSVPASRLIGSRSGSYRSL